MAQQNGTQQHHDDDVGSLKMYTACDTGGSRDRSNTGPHGRDASSRVYSMPSFRGIPPQPNSGQEYWSGRR